MRDGRVDGEPIAGTPAAERLGVRGEQQGGGGDPGLDGAALQPAPPVRVQPHGPHSGNWGVCPHA